MELLPAFEVQDGGSSTDSSNTKNERFRKKSGEGRMGFERCGAQLLEPAHTRELGSTREHASLALKFFPFNYGPAPQLCTDTRYHVSPAFQCRRAGVKPSRHPQRQHHGPVVFVLPPAKSAWNSSTIAAPHSFMGACFGSMRRSRPRLCVAAQGLQRIWRPQQNIVCDASGVSCPSAHTIEFPS